MSDAEKMAVVSRYFGELWNKGCLEAAEDIIAPEFGGSGVISGPEAAKMYVSSYRSAFPDINFRILCMRCEGNMVTACWVGTGAHEPSECLEEALKGNRRTITGLSVYRIEAGRIAEMWIGSEAMQLANNNGPRNYSPN